MAIKRILLKKPEGRYNYTYLRFYRPNEKITRVDKFSIIMYWDAYDSNGKLIRLHELFFYPSPYGAEEIDRDPTKQLSKKLKQLIEFGNCWWEYSVDYELNPDNWMLKNYQLSNNQPIPKLKLKPKKKKRHRLKSKSKRLRLKSK